MQWDHCPAVERAPQRVSGAWVFRGTRIPAAALFQNPHPRVRFGVLPGKTFAGLFAPRGFSSVRPEK